MRVRKVEKAPKKAFFDTKGKRIAAISVLAAILLVMVVVMYIDTTDKCQLTVKNNSGLNLEYVKAKYVSSDIDLTNTIQTDKLVSGKSITIPSIPFEYSGLDACYELIFKFENKTELYVDAGSFGNNYNGPIHVNFEKTNDPEILKMTIKAKSGLLLSKTVYCDDVFTVDFKQDATYAEQ